jgi:deoxyribose-phosphate aldolase
MLAVVDMAHSALAATGVIVEAEPMSEELVRRACRLAERAGADHVVTSSGHASVRATLARTRVLRDSVGPRIGVKAAGRFRSADQVVAAGDAGASRVSAVLTATLARVAADPPVVPAVAG